VLEATQHLTRLTPNHARALLGHFLFSGEEAEKPLDGLSGGERRRLSLAILVHSGANVLILDEPTNHLDLESREALEEALSAFEGSLLLVSHDRALLDAVGSRTVAVEDRTLHSYVGGWPEYVRVRAERAAADADAERVRSQPAGRSSSGSGRAKAGGNGSETAKRGGGSAPREKQRPESRAQRQLEREIQTSEAALKLIEDELTDPAAWSDPKRSADSTARHQAAKREIEGLYARWERIAG